MNQEQEIKKQEYEKQDLPTSLLKSEDTRVMEKIVQQVKSKSNEQNQMLMNLKNIVETHDLITEEIEYVEETN